MAMPTFLVQMHDCTVLVWAWLHRAFQVACAVEAAKQKTLNAGQQTTQRTHCAVVVLAPFHDVTGAVSTSENTAKPALRAAHSYRCRRCC